MPDYTKAADLAAGQIAMVASARYTMEHAVVSANTFTKMQLGAGNKSQYIPKFGKITASDLTDGIDMTEGQQLTITGTEHTTDEAGCKVIITKKLRNQLKEDAYRAAGKVIGNAMGKKIDQDGLSLYSGLNSGLGAAATTLTLGYHAAAVAQCIGQSEPTPMPLVAVYHPYQINAFVDQLSVPSSTLAFPDALSLPLLQAYWRGSEKLYGTPIFGAGNISIDSSEDAYGAIYSPMAFIYLVGWEPENWLEEDKSLRGWEIGIVADYGMVEEDGTYGRYMLFDAAAPVS
jgi:hypothetical protein